MCLTFNFWIEYSFTYNQKIKINDGAKVQVPVSDVTDGEVVISPNDPVSLEQPDEVNKEGLEPSETAWGGRGTLLTLSIFFILINEKKRVLHCWSSNF